MKKIVLFALAVIIVLCTASCGAKPQNIEDENGSGDETALDPTKFNLAATGSTSPFDHMSKAAFRKEIRPYLEAWYEFCYKGMWWLALDISENEETLETESGNIYVKAADFNTRNELASYLSDWISYRILNKKINEQTLENESGLYLLQIATGWYGVPDFNDCELVGVKDNKYYVSFSEENELYPEESTVHFVVFEILGGKLLVSEQISFAQGLEVAVGKILSEGITPDVMTTKEFADFIALLLYRYSEAEGHLNFDENSIKICTDEWVKTVEGASCAAEVMINGKWHYVIIGADINGIYRVIGISET